MKLPADYVERVYAGWLGKVMGVRHGAPVEGWSHEDIARLFPSGEGFLTDIDVFEPDDDINGPLFFLRALEDENKGEDISSMETARAWTNYAPYEHGFYWWPGYGKPTSYHMIEKGEAALDHSGEKPGDGLGPRIFSDTWGLVAPGNPKLAARLMRTALLADAAPGGAAEDAAVLQVALVSLAFAEKTVESLLTSALTHIPEQGDIARMARDILSFYRENPQCPEAARLRIVEKWSAPVYPGMFHAVSNTAYILLGLLYSGGNLKRGLDLCTRCGLDTDCNSGNLGAVLGVFGGLESIDHTMRRKMNDVAICSSILGEQNMGDIPTQAKYIALRGYVLNAQEPPETLCVAQNSGLYLDFAFTGSTHGLRVESDSDSILNPIDGGLKIFCGTPYPRTGMRVFHRTYYRPKEVHNNRYDPCFSPKVYPGQALTAMVKKDPSCNAEVAASLFAYDDNAKVYYEGPTVRLGSDSMELRYSIPPLSGALISKVGVRFTMVDEHPRGFTVHISHLSARGAPDYEMDFRKERMDAWGFVQHECSQFTYTRGRWHYEGERLVGAVSSHGEVLTGARSFRDIAAECTIIPYTEKGAGLIIRAQGAFRYYAAVLRTGGAALVKQNHGETTLAEAPFDWRSGQPVRLQLEAKGQQIRLYHEGKMILEAVDGMFESGLVGLCLSGDCAHGAFERLSIKGIPEEE
jgi:hypothetical protein